MAVIDKLIPAVRALEKWLFTLRYPKAPKTVPDYDLYTPFFSPWNKPPFSTVTHTLVSPDRCYVLYTLAAQTEGHIVECGVYKGGTAKLLHSLGRPLHLYDTFCGMPDTHSEFDLHQRGTFGDVNINEVHKLAPNALLNVGLIPHTFVNLPDPIGFAHIDVDIYQSVRDCCEHLYPKMAAHSFMVFDDYGFPSCPGARKAIDEFFSDKPEKPLVLPTAQAVVFISRSP